eukprot:3253843-Amphidinium_carterae.1
MHYALNALNAWRNSSGHKFWREPAVEYHGHYQWQSHSSSAANRRQTARSDLGERAKMVYNIMF